MVTTLEPPTRTARRAPASPPPLTFRQRLNRADVRVSPYLYVAPFFVLFGLVGLFPLVYTFVVSLNHWDLLSGPGAWIGLKNFTDELGDDLFWNSLGNTFSIFVLSAVPQLIAATVIAAVLDQNLRAKTFWRMSVLLPYVVTPVAVSLIFSSLFGESYGLVNNALHALGLGEVLWKTDPLASHLAIASMINWRWTGYNALILLAAMQAVPRDLHESAEIDGAGSARRFFSITIPSIRPTFIFVVITATIGGLQVFTEPKLFDASSATPGGSFRQYQTTVLYLWDLAFNRGDFGKASAVAWMLFLVIIAIGLVNFAVSRRIASAETAVRTRRTRRRLQRHRDRQIVDAVPPLAENHLERLP